MSAGRLNILGEQGSTFNRQITWTDSEKVPIDITGFTGRMQVRTAIGEPIVLGLTTENTRLDIPNGTDGIINMLVDAVTMSALTAGDYIYDLEMTHLDGVTVTRLLKGVFCVSAAVTV